MPMYRATNPPAREARWSWDGYWCSLARHLSADRQVHLRMEPGVMTRLFYASPQAIKNPALRVGLNAQPFAEDAASASGSYSQ